ncbi:hypothetical protein JCM1840_004299 [Sporobolomyces johnsonii]
MLHRRALHHLLPRRPVKHTSDLPPLPSVIHSTQSVIERKSVFVGHAVKVKSVEEATLALQHILTLKKVSKATHNILAYRLSSSSAATSQGSTTPAATIPEVAGSDDDGESPAGKNLLELLHKLDIRDVLIVVTRWYGGVQLGPDRFRVINTVAKEALALGGLIKRSGRAKK